MGENLGGDEHHQLEHDGAMLIVKQETKEG